MQRANVRGAIFRLAQVGVAGVACLVLANCSSSDKFARRVDPKYGVSTSPRVVDAGEPIPKGGGTFRVGKPYQVAGRTYIPEEDVNYSAEGLASWYGDDFHGRLTANGEVFDMYGISAAHPTLPMPCYVRVTNLANRKSIIVRVNDRGPYHQNRLIDVSVKTAQLLGFHANGVARVRVEYVGRAPLDGLDDQQLIATLRQGEPAPPPSLVMLASAKPFVPQLRERSAVLRGPTPMPPDRPFTLGEPQAEPGTASDWTASARRSRERTAIALADNERGEAALRSSASPAAGFAQASTEGSLRLTLPSAVMTGRGLY